MAGARSQARLTHVQWIHCRDADFYVDRMAAAACLSDFAYSRTVAFVAFCSNIVEAQTRCECIANRGIVTGVNGLVVVDLGA